MKTLITFSETLGDQIYHVFVGFFAKTGNSSRQRKLAMASFYHLPMYLCLLLLPFYSFSLQFPPLPLSIPPLHDPYVVVLKIQVWDGRHGLGCMPPLHVAAEIFFEAIPHSALVVDDSCNRRWALLYFPLKFL